MILAAAVRSEAGSVLTIFLVLVVRVSIRLPDKGFCSGGRT